MSPPRPSIRAHRHHAAGKGANLGLAYRVANYGPAGHQNGGKQQIPGRAHRWLRHDPGAVQDARRSGADQV